MKLYYYPETDSLYIDLNANKSEDSQEIAEGLVVDFDAEGNIVGIDIDRTSEKLDLKTLHLRFNSEPSKITLNLWFNSIKFTQYQFLYQSERYRNFFQKTIKNVGKSG